MLFYFFVLLTWNSCSHQQKDCSVAKEDTIPPGNINKDSELTLQMRNMTDRVFELKNIIQEGATLQSELVNEFSSILTAEPSDSNKQGHEFDRMANIFMEEVRKLEHAESNRLANFNIMVNSCIDCHKVFCPGPIPRIKKLKIY